MNEVTIATRVAPSSDKKFVHKRVREKRDSKCFPSLKFVQLDTYTDTQKLPVSQKVLKILYPIEPEI